MIALNESTSIHEPALTELGFLCLCQDAFHYAHETRSPCLLALTTDRTYKTKDHGTKSDTKGKVASTSQLEASLSNGVGGSSGGID